MKIWKVNNYENYYKDILVTDKVIVEPMLLNTYRKTYYQNYFEVYKKNGIRKICIFRDTKAICTMI